MGDDNVSFDKIAGTEDDILDPYTANTNEDYIYSAGDPDNTALTEDVDDEDDA